MRRWFTLLLLGGAMGGVSCACLAEPNAYTPANYPQYNHQEPSYPPPVELPIQNIPQQTQVWCWAAVAQQIIMASRGPNGTPAQCELVAQAYGRHPASCCGDIRRCTVTGQLPQIQKLIAEFGGRHSSIEAPTDPMTVYRTLKAGKAIILAVKSSPYAGHVVVLRGMAWMPTPWGIQPMLLINDPMAYYAQPVPFSELARVWDAAIVVR